MSAEENQKTRCIYFDAKVFSLIAVKKASYKYMKVFSADIQVENDQIKCLLSFSSPLSDERYEGIVSDFRSEVLDQDLRESLKIETEPVRNLILAHAFSKTGIVGDGPISRD